MQTIANYMTKQPWAVQVDDSIAVARQMMAEREIHHLPVLDGGELVGMLTHGDVAREGATVEEVMGLACAVDANVAFGDALEVMLARGRDAVVITRDGKIEGIFTAMDAVRVLRDRMRPRRPRAEPPRSGAW
ncbi:MAG: CBS domain-containing protein [Deltaproteobacteria bacterium]|nr:CBS domain-containing protein [Deltaproteobacteria bacterium]